MRIPSVPPEWASLAEEVNQREETLMQHTFRCVVSLLACAKAPKFDFAFVDINSVNMPIVHANDLMKLVEYCYDNSLLVFGKGEDPVMFMHLRKAGLINVTVYLTAVGVVFLTGYQRMRHHATIAGDIHIGPLLTENILH